METKADERIRKLEETINSFINTRGLEAREPSEETKKYLNLSRDDIIRMSIDECAEAIYLLAQFAFFLELSYNKEISRANWAEANIKIMVAPCIHDYQGYSFEERKLQAIHAGEITTKLEKFRVDSKLNADLLQNVSRRVEYMSKTINDIKFSKMRKISNE